MYTGTMMFPIDIDHRKNATALRTVSIFIRDFEFLVWGAVPNIMVAGDSSIKKNGLDIVCELDYRGTKNINAYELNI